MLRLNGLHIKFEVAPSPVSAVHVTSAVRVTSAVHVNSAVHPLSTHGLPHL